MALMDNFSPDNPDAIVALKTSATAGIIAASSPLWVQHLSELAATYLPIVGFAFLLLQAGVFIYKNFFRKPKKAPTE